MKKRKCCPVGRLYRWTDSGGLGSSRLYDESSLVSHLTGAVSQRNPIIDCLVYDDLFTVVEEVKIYSDHLKGTVYDLKVVVLNAGRHSCRRAESGWLRGVVRLEFLAKELRKKKSKAGERS